MKFERFSERCGYVKVDDALQIERMSDGLKNLLWNYICEFLREEDNMLRPSLSFMKCVFEYWWKEPFDAIPQDYYKRRLFFKKKYESFNWNEVYDTLDFICFYCKRNEYFRLLDKFTNNINCVLERERSGYRLIAGLVSPITDKNEISGIKEAIEENLLDTAKTHIQKALDMLADRENPDYRNSIKESISAVEAVCRYITKASTLDRALPKLKNKGIIIPDMLCNGMEKLYYFTNGEAGIRHALMDENIGIDFEEAKYMLVVCSAFINYLKEKLVKLNSEE